MNNEFDQQIDRRLNLHTKEEDAKFEQLFSDIKELRREMTAFTEAWQQARGAVTFIKWLISIIGGITAALLFIKDHIK